MLVSRRSFIGSVTAAAFAEAFGAPTGEVRLKVGVLSDLHISPEEVMLPYLKGDRTKHRARGTELFERALRYFDGQGADAVVLAGDLTDWGLKVQLRALAETWQKVFPGGKSNRDGRKVEMLAVTGNHDTAFRAWTRPEGNYATPAIGTAVVPDEEKLMFDTARKWEEIFHEPYAPIRQKVVKGYTFILAGWDTDDGIAAVEPYMAEHGPKLAGTKPFFYVQHPHPRWTCFWPDATGYDKGQATRALEKYPNAVAISGHAHLPLTDDRNVWQGSFTSLGAATLGTPSLCRGRENGARRGSRGYAMKSLSAAKANDGKEAAAHGMMMRVYDGAIELERMDFVSGRRLGPNWVLPVPAKGGEGKFGGAELAANGPAGFPKGAKASAKVVGNKIHLEFPAANIGSGHARALEYEIEAQSQVGPNGLMFRRYVYAGDVMLPEGTLKRVTADFSRDLVPGGVRVRFAIRARDSVGRCNEAIHCNFVD